MDPYQQQSPAGQGNPQTLQGAPEAPSACPHYTGSDGTWPTSASADSSRHSAPKSVADRARSKPPGSHSNAPLAIQFSARFPQLAAKFAARCRTLTAMEKRLVFHSMDSEMVQEVAIAVFSEDIDKGLAYEDVFKQFAAFQTHFIQEFSTWHLSCVSVVTEGLSPQQAIKRRCDAARAAAQQGAVTWTSVLDVFGDTPELWGVQVPFPSEAHRKGKGRGRSSADLFRPEPSGNMWSAASSPAPSANTSKLPPAKLEVQPSVGYSINAGTDFEDVGPYTSTSRQSVTDPIPDHGSPGSYDFVPYLDFQTAATVMSPDKVYESGTPSSTHYVPPTVAVPDPGAATTTPGLPQPSETGRRIAPSKGVSKGVNYSTDANDFVSVLLNHPDAFAFLEAFGHSSLLPGFELSELLRDVLRFDEPPSLPSRAGSNTHIDNVASRSGGDPALSFRPLGENSTRDPLTIAIHEKLIHLHEFKEVHRVHVETLWGIVRHMKQWHTSCLEIQYLHERRGTFLSEELFQLQRDLMIIIDGFTALVFQLLVQQERFRPPELLLLHPY